MKQRRTNCTLFPMIQSIRINHWLVWLLLCFCLLSPWLITLLPDLTVQLLCLFGGVFPLLIVVVSALVVRHRIRLSQWRGWLGIVAVVAFLTITKEIWLLRTDTWVIVGGLFFIGVAWTLVCSTAGLVWRHDVGLTILSWGTVIGMWALMFWWRANPTMFTDLVATLGTAEGITPGILDTLFCFFWCVFPLCAISFVYHTFRLLWQEFRP